MNPSHFNKLKERRPQLEAILPDIEKACQLLLDSLKNNGQLLLCGNGGSASDADHIAGELLKGFKSKRPLSPSEKEGLPEALATQLQGGIRAIPLTSFSALSTAFTNDVDPLLTYAQLTWALGRTGDVLLGISTSGNAVNVGHAARTAKAKGMKVIGLTGQSGGALKELCDVCICAPSTETYLIQEFHLPIYHCICLTLESELFPEEN